MRIFAITGAAALALLSAAVVPASAARWCAGNDCGFASRRHCVASTGRPDICHRAVAGRRAVTPGGYGGRQAAPAALPQFPNRPYNAAPGECYIDEGYGRFSSCNAAGGWGG
jgi:hypothetical protein